MTPTNLLQIGNDIDRSVYEQILQFIRLRVTETYAFPPEIVRVDDITIATLGNFSASVGKPKSKKPFNITAIVAGGYTQGAFCSNGTEQLPLPQGAGTHPTAGRAAY